MSTKQPTLQKRPKIRKNHQKTPKATKPAQPDGLLALQAQIGNAAVQRLLVQRKGQGSLALDQDSAQAIANLAQRDDAEAADQLGTKTDTGKVIIENVVYEPYDVTGSTLAEVAAQLDPKEWGQCHYQFDHSYETTAGRTTKVDITLHLTIHLPRWQGKGWQNASEAAKTEWQRMISALEAHENGHAEIARRWAPIFKEKMMGVSEGKVQQRYDETKAAVGKETNKYDKETSHGKSKGVTLDITVQ